MLFNAKTAAQIPRDIFTLQVFHILPSIILLPNRKQEGAGIKIKIMSKMKRGEKMERRKKSALPLRRR
jgi:hypothetical protein